MRRALCDLSLPSACFSRHQPSMLGHSAAGTTLKENTGLYTRGNKNCHSQSGKYCKATMGWSQTQLKSKSMYSSAFSDLCVFLRGKPCRNFNLNNLSLLFVQCPSEKVTLLFFFSFFFVQSSDVFCKINYHRRK